MMNIKVKAIKGKNIETKIIYYHTDEEIEILSTVDTLPKRNKIFHLKVNFVTFFYKLNKKN